MVRRDTLLFGANPMITVVTATNLMDPARVRYLTNFKAQIETKTKELVRSLHQEPVLQLKYRGIPYSAK